MSKLKELREIAQKNEKELTKLQEETIKINKEIDTELKNIIDPQELAKKITANSLAQANNPNKQLLENLTKEKKELEKQKVKLVENEKKLTQLSERKISNSIAIAANQEKQESSLKEIDARYLELTKQSTSTDLEPKELAEIKKELEEHKNFQQKRSANLEKIYQSEKKNLINNIKSLLSEKNQHKLENIFATLARGEGEKTEGLKFGKGALKSFGFVLSNLSTVGSLVSSAAFLNKEAEKMAKVLSEEEKYNPQNPPFFMRLLQDKDFESFLKDNPKEFANLLDKIAPSIVPVILTELGKVDAIKQEMASKKKEFDALPEKEKQLEELQKLQNKRPTMKQAEEIINLKEEIEPLKLIQRRFQIANTIDSLKKSGIGEKYIKDKLLPIITEPIKELLKNPEDLIKVANLGVKMVQSKDETEKSKIFGDILNQVNIAKILDTSDLKSFLINEGEELAKIAVTALSANDNLKEFVQKNGISDEAIKSFVPLATKLAGHIISDTEGITQLFDALKPTISNNIEDSQKPPPILEIAANLLLKDEVLKVVVEDLPKALEENQNVIVDILSKQSSIIPVLKDTDPELYKNIVPPLVNLTQEALGSVTPENIKNIYNNASIILNAESEPAAKDAAIGDVIKEAVPILGSEKLTKAISENVGKILTDPAVQEQLPSIISNAAENIPAIKNLGITKEFIENNLPTAMNVAASALPPLMNLTQKALGSVTPENIKNIYNNASIILNAESEPAAKDAAIGDVIKEAVPILGSEKLTKAISENVGKILTDPAVQEQLPSIISNAAENIPAIKNLGITKEFIENNLPTAMNVAASALPLVTEIMQSAGQSPEVITEIYKNIKEKNLDGMLENGTKMVKALNKELSDSLPKFLVENKGNIEKIVANVVEQKLVADALNTLGIPKELVKEATSASLDLISPMLPVITKLANESLKYTAEVKNIITKTQEVLGAEEKQPEKIAELARLILDLKDKPEVKDIIEKEIPNILQTQAATLGPVVDKFLEQTPIGKSLRAKGQEILNAAAPKFPQIMEVAELFTKKKYGKLIPKALKLAFDKKIFPLVVKSVVDVIKFKYNEKTRANNTRRLAANKEVSQSLEEALKENAPTEKTAEKTDIGKSIEERGKNAKGKIAKYSMINRDFHGLHFDKQKLEFDNCIIENFNFKDAKFGPASFKNAEIKNSSFENVEFKEKIDLTGMKIDQKSVDSFRKAVQKYNDKHQQDPEKTMDFKDVNIITKEESKLTKAIDEIKKKLAHHKTTANVTHVPSKKSKDKEERTI